MEHNNELYIPVPVDIDAVKSKFLFGLTLRQIFCFAVGIGIGLGAYFGLQGIVGTTIAGIAMMTVMLPALFFAVYEQHGEPMDISSCVNKLHVQVQNAMSCAVDAGVPMSEEYKEARRLYRELVMARDIVDAFMGEKIQ